MVIGDPSSHSVGVEVDERDPKTGFTSHAPSLRMRDGVFRICTRMNYRSVSRGVGFVRRARWF